MADDTIQDAYGPLQGYPTTFIIDRDGQIRNKKLGREPVGRVREGNPRGPQAARALKQGAGLAITP